MAETRRKFTREFKVAAVRRLQAAFPVGPVARELEVNPNQLYAWRREFELRPNRAFYGEGRRRGEESPVAELERKIGQQADQLEDALKLYCGQKIWPSLRDEEAIRLFAGATGDALQSFCRLIATAEKIVYDKRARTLKESHPLALQVNLDTGVANGVLVVRTIPDCAALLRRVLLGEMEFSLEEKAGMWYLREKISGCIYRVVTNDRKLNNCFWNFYLR